MRNINFESCTKKGRVTRDLTERFKLLHDRFIAIALDYTYYINSDLRDHTIYDLRDNIIYRLYSARFHFKLLLEQHHRVEGLLKELYIRDAADVLHGGYKVSNIIDQSTKEVYSLFDSMIYHICSIYDYLFRLVNFTNGKTIASQPKWNLFKHDKNLKKFVYCSKDIIPKLTEIDTEFVYPLIKHRSHLIHTSKETGSFKMNFKLGGDNFKAKFLATQKFKTHFTEITKEFGDIDLTVKFVSLWLIDKAIVTITEVLFELRADMERNQKIPHGQIVMLGSDNTIQSPSSSYWGDKSKI